MDIFLNNVLPILMLVVGFGFVIFWHELGHFLAAKRVGIKVEQFAVGMGHALVSFRKGIGVKLGNTRAEYDRRVKAHLVAKGFEEPKDGYSNAQVATATEELGLGETEYRLSWIPIGGYVKMLGQDDMKAGADAEDPRAFNKKTIGQRMQVVSAGVIMNIILAGLLFMVLFLIGFHAPAPVVGAVQAGSPAQQAGIRPGDTIVSIDGAPMHDFTKVTLATALAPSDQPLHVVVKRYDTGKIEDVFVQPIRQSSSSKAFLALGVYGAPSLQGPAKEHEAIDPKLLSADMLTVRAGDVITKVNGRDVGVEDYARLDQAIQESGGRAVELTVRRKAGQVETVRVTPHLDGLFGLESNSVNLAGLQPRMRVAYIPEEQKKAPAYGALLPGDVIVALGVRGSATPASQPADQVADISVPAFIERVNKVGEQGQSLEVTVLRDGKQLPPFTVKPAKMKDAFRLGVAAAYDDQNAVVGGVVDKSSAANAKDGIQPGSAIRAVDGKPVANWFDVRDAFKAAKPGDHTITLLPPNAEKPVERTITLTKADIELAANLRLEASLLLREWTIVRQTGNPLTALGWGALETRDLILQFYVTLQRMFGGSISHKNLMGPVGIFGAGAQFAFKGTDWLLWFLAMISANLAVVNFLPIPIVDGGLFLFLIIEKIQGRPLSRRTQEIAQFAGLALILGIFVMVTFNDIQRFFN